MFNLKYNILALYQVLLGLMSSVLMLRVFGVTPQADAFLIASSIVTSLQFIQIMFVEQFMFFYNDLKVQSRESATEFYSAAICFSLLSGVILYLLFALTAQPLITLFAFGIDAQRHRLLETVLQVLFIGSIFESVNLINLRLMNAEMSYATPYLLSSFQSLFTVLALVYLSLSAHPEVTVVATARICGTGFTCLAGFAVVRRMGFPVRRRLRHPALKPFIMNSLAMRVGCNIHNILINPITNNILALLPGGFASSFYYAQRLHQVVNNVVVGPSYGVFQSRVSRHWSEQNPGEIRSDIRKFLPPSVLGFLLAVTAMFLLVPSALTWVGSASMRSADIELIQNIFLALVPWYLIALLESPFLSVCIASKRSVIFFASNTAFIVAYFLLSFFMKQQFGVYSITIGMASAQIINLASFVLFSASLLSAGGAGPKTGLARWL